MTELNLDSTFDDLGKVLSAGYTNMMYEAFLISMKSQTHKSVTKLFAHVHEDNVLKTNCLLAWMLPIDEKMLRSHKNDNQTTDFAAMFLSLGLIKESSEVKALSGEFGCFETSVLGTGIDFWLAEQKDFPRFKARLEVSGIRTKSATNNIRYRLKKKLSQIKKSDVSNLPVFIVIVEFSSPEILIFAQ